MKTFTQLLFILFLFPFSYSASAQLAANSPSTIIRCHTVEAEQQAQLLNPNIETRDEFEKWLKQLILQRNLSANRTNIDYTLPVIFHVINNGEAEGSGYNIARALVESNLYQINRDYANLSASAYGSAANTGIQFRMAEKDPNGATLAIPGIERINRTTKGYSTPPYSLNYINSTIKPGTIWDPTKYINIWILPLSASLAGFATVPGTSGLNGLDNSETNTSAGVVVDPKYIGSSVNPNTGCGSNPYNYGRSLTHELGHFFGLVHIWGDSNCGTDYVDDTPIHQSANYGVAAHPKANSCGTADEMFENYMDYSDDRVMNTFTAGQVARMQTVMLNSPRRKELVTSTAGLVNVTSNKISFDVCFNSTTVVETSNAGTFPTKYRDVPVIVNVEDRASGSATLNITPSGSGGGSDYQILNPSIAYNTGDGAKVITVRILDDAIAELTKTIILNYTISGAGITAGAAGQTYSITLVDDDAVRPGQNTVTLLSENFETAAAALPAGWLPFSSGGFPNSFVVSSNGSAGGSGQCLHVTNNVATKPNTYTKTISGATAMRTPLIDVSGLTNLNVSFKYRVAGEVAGNTANDYGLITYATESAPTTFVQLPGSDVYASNSLSAGSPNIPLGVSFYNTKLHLAYYWQNNASAGTDPGLNVDDVLFTGQPVNIETTAATNNTWSIAAGNNNVYFKSQQNNRVITLVQNASSAISALTASITEAGNDRPVINTHTGTYARSRKVIRLTPSVADNTTQYKATFYFTTAEMADWGASATSLKILKVRDGANLGSTLTTGDAQVITPTIDDRRTSDGYMAFTGDFTGFSQFVLIDPSVVLPLSWLSFKGVLGGNKVQLYWSTANEQNNSGFEVERSIDGVDYKKIGWVKGANGALNQYSLDDNSIEKGNHYLYRLKQFDLDGKVSYSPVVEITYPGEGLLFTLYPNPVNDKLLIQNLGNTKSKGLTITDMGGRIVYKHSAVLPAKLEISTQSWSAGTYTVQIIAHDKPVSYKIVKE